jgi:hypothetical protein
MLLVGMAILGLGYAKWSETLTIDGTVNTGIVDAELSAGESWDTEPTEKDVSSISCYVDPENPKRLIVTLKNAYPSIDYYQEFDIHNTGTIPVKVENITIDRGNLPSGATVEIPDLAVGEQLEPSVPEWFTLHVHLDNDAVEDTTYAFSIDIDVTQWNEVP